MDEQFQLVNDACGLVSLIMQHWADEIGCSKTALSQAAYMVLITYVWEKNRDKPTLTKTELNTHLCTVLDVKPRTAQDYVSDAVRLNLLAIEPHPTDKRVKVVVVSMRLYQSLRKFAEKVRPSSLESFSENEPQPTVSQSPFELRESNS